MLKFDVHFLILECWTIYWLFEAVKLLQAGQEALVRTNVPAVSTGTVPGDRRMPATVTWPTLFSDRTAGPSSTRQQCQFARFVKGPCTQISPYVIQSTSIDHTSSHNSTVHKLHCTFKDLYMCRPTCIPKSHVINIIFISNFYF